VRPQRLADADRDRLLADGQMHGAFDPVAGVDAGDLFLDAADPVQGSVQALIHAAGLRFLPRRRRAWTRAAWVRETAILAEGKKCVKAEWLTVPAGRATLTTSAAPRRVVAWSGDHATTGSPRHTPTGLPRRL